MIRTDRYTLRQWSAMTRIPSWEEVAAAIPEGHDLHVTHGGNTYTARLYRDGKAVSEHRSTRLAGALTAAVTL